MPVLLGFSAALATGRNAADSVTVVPAPEYTNGWPFGLLFGGNQQSLWLTPLRVEQVNLTMYAGGLTPDYEVIDPDARVLVLHTPRGDTLYFSPLRQHVTEEDVDPRDRRLVPTHPSGALVADALGAAAGLPGLHPKLVWFPDDPLLGAFRSAFGGVPGYLTGQYAEAGPSAARRVDSPELLRALQADSRNRVDARLYLTSRFIDLLTGDWERSLWKWQWLRRVTDGHDWFTPLPLLHRQAFVHLSSVFSIVHAVLTPGFVNYGEEMEDVGNTVATAATLDQRILAPIDRQTWDSAAAAFVAKMTDSVIDAAVRTLPPEHFQLAGVQMARSLRSRRDSFRTISDEFYHSLAGFLNVTLSDADEYVTIERRSNGSVDVSAWQRSSIPVLVYHRTFVPEESEEIRLLCGGGNDTVIVSGNADRSIPLRISGGPGNDVLRDDSLVRGPALGFIRWISTTETMTYFYDHEGSNTVHEGPGTNYDDSPASAFVPPGRFF